MTTSVLTPEKQFLVLAAEIKTRIETTRFFDWWKDVELLSLQLERQWQQFRTRFPFLRKYHLEHPAFIVLTCRRGQPVPNPAAMFAEFPAIPKGSPTQTVTRLSFCDPMSASSSSADISEVCEGEMSTHRDDEYRIQSIEILSSWIRAVEGSILGGNSIAGRKQPGELAEETNEWITRRHSLGETVEQQMMVLYKKDKRTAELKSPEIAEILGCKAQAVRKKGNAVWKMFQEEKGRREQLLSQKLRRTNSKSDDDD